MKTYYKLLIVCYGEKVGFSTVVVRNGLGNVRICKAANAIWQASVTIPSAILKLTFTTSAVLRNNLAGYLQLLIMRQQSSNVT